jgi:hypothetical protein
MAGNTFHGRVFQPAAILALMEKGVEGTIVAEIARNGSAGAVRR